MAFWRSVIRYILTPPSTNYLYRKIDPAPYDFLPPYPLILDIGSREARGRYAFGDPPEGSRSLCVDIEDGPGVDVVADAHDLHMFSNDAWIASFLSVFRSMWGIPSPSSLRSKPTKRAEPSLREKLIKIGAKVVSHGRYVTFQMAEVAVSRQMLAEILSLIARLRAPPAPA